jgi:hypothetical protein
MSKWLMDRTASLLATRTSRRGMLVRSAIVGSALATNPGGYILRPISAYAAACQCRGQPCSCGTACCDGYTEFCCSIYGENKCPSGTAPAGWWRAEGSGLCGGASRYYMDCNQLLDAPNQCSCSCANGDCNHRVTCCTHFRYGQCHQEIPQVGAIACRVVTCTPPWQIDPTCTSADARDDATRFHDAPCLHEAPKPPKDRLATAQWFLRTSPTSGGADISFPYGDPGDQPITGDWNGDGVDTVGVRRGNVFLLRNSNTPGPAEIAFVFGDPNDYLIIGDWDGDGIDGVGVVRGNTWYLRNSLTSGPADMVFNFGNPLDRPVVGKWRKGQKADAVGVVRGNTWYLRNNATGLADITFDYGDPNDKVLVGDWDGDGVDTPCVVRGSTYYARNSNSSGVADVVFQYGDTGDLLLAGKWKKGAPTGPGVAR